MEQITHTVVLDGPKPNLMVTEGVFKSRPVCHIIYLDGYGKPLSMGPGKVKMILHAIPQLAAFYEKHKASLSSDE